MTYPDGALRRRDDLNPNPGEADREQSKLLRGRARQVNDATLYEGASVIDPNDDVRARVHPRHTDHCTERQLSMSCGEFVR